MIRSKLNYFLALGLCFLVVSFTLKDTEKELKEKADTHFENEAFIKALPIYAQLLAINSKDVDLNFKYGACLIYSDQGTNEPIKYLSYATKNNASKEALYFLGKAYHLNYQFKDAIDAYSKFLEEADNKLKQKHKDAQRQIEQCAFGSNLLSNIKDIAVLDKVQTADVEFFRNYDLSDIGGRILVTPDELLSSNDKKKNHRSLIHFPGDASVIYFSSYGKEDNLDIYKASVLGNGEYSKPVKLDGNVNTPFDENFPYMHPDGSTFYFSSKGHNSMGGYDIYKCESNGGGFFNAPENLDFAINSPDDDIFYIADVNKKLAYFASSRSSEQGQIHVYKVQVQTFPLNIAIIKGAFNSEISEDNFNASISVQNATTNEEVGTFYTKVEDGEYIIVLPKAGRYKFYVEATDSRYTHSGMVEIPPSNKIRAFKQTMDLVEVNEKEKLIIKNLFDQELDDDVMALMQQVIKERAQLNVNSTEDDINDVIVSDFSQIYQQAGFGVDSNRESIEKRLSDREEQMASVVEQEKKIASESKKIAQEKKDSSQENLAKAEEYYSLMNASSDDLEKEKLLIEAAKYKGASLSNADAAIIALETGNFFETESGFSEDRLNEFRSRNEVLSEALSSEDEKALDLLIKQKDVLDKKIEDSPEDKLAKKAAETRKEAEKLVNKATNLSDEYDALTKRIDSKKKSLEKIKKEKDKVQVQNEILVLEEELEFISKDKNKTFEELAEKQKVASIMEGGRSLTEDIDAGVIEVEGNVRENPSEIDEGIADIIVRNENIKISEVEIQEILIRRPNLVNQYFSDEKELASFKKTYHLPDFITIDENNSDFADSASINNSTSLETIQENEINSEEDIVNEISTEEIEEVSSDLDLAKTDDVIVPEMTTTDLEMVSDPNQLNDLLDSKFIAVEEVKEFIMPGYENEREEIENGNLDEIEKVKRSKDLNQNLIQSIEHSKEDLQKSFEAGDMTQEIYEKNVKFLDNLAFSEKLELSENIQFLNDHPTSVNQTGEVSDQTNDIVSSVSDSELPENTDVETSEIESTAPNSELESVGLESSYSVLDQRIKTLNQQEIPFIDKAKQEIKAREDFVSVAAEKADQNKINIKYAPNEEIESKLEEENQLLYKIIDQQYAEIAELNEAISSNDEFASTDLNSDNFNELDSEEEVSLEVTKLVNEADLDPEINSILEGGIKVMPYKSQAARGFFLNQEELISERDALLETDFEAAVEKEIEIIEFSKKANRSEAEDLMEELQFEYPNEVKEAKESMLKASVIRAGAVLKDDRNEKAFYLKKAYAYEIKAINNLNSLKGEDTSSNTNEEYANLEEAEVFESQARSFGINSIDKIDDDYAENITKVNQEEYLDVLKNDLGYSQEETIEILQDHDQLTKLIKDWKVAQIEDEIKLQENSIEEYQREYDKNIKDYREIELQLNETSNEAELKNLNDQADIAVRKADVFDYYKKIAAINISKLEAKRNDVLNGELELASVNSNPEDYLEIKEFVEKYYENQGPFETDDVLVEETETTDISVSNNTQETINSETEENIALNNPNLETDFVDAAGDNAKSTSEGGSLDTLENSEGETIIESNAAELNTESSNNDIDVVETSEQSQENTEDQTTQLIEETTDTIVSDSINNSDQIDSNEIIENATETLTDQSNGSENVLEETTNAIDSDSINNSDQIDSNEIVENATETVTNQNNSSENDLGEITNESDKTVTDVSKIEILDSQTVSDNNGVRTTVTGGNPNDVVEYQPTADRDTQLKIIADDGSEVDYNYKEGDVAGLNNTINSKPFNSADGFPSNLENELFFLGEDNVNAYSEADGGIPLDIEMPSGLVFQVQVGAFYRPVDPSVFAGFAPLNGQRSSSGLIRYRAGMFKIFDTANDAKNQIRAKGFDDAFVVAFLDGQRISLFEARNLLDPQTIEKYNYLARTEKAEAASSSVSNASESVSAVDNANPIDRIEGLFYTVQVGVYSKNVAKEVLFNLDPLNSQQTANRKIRYTSGIFRNFEEATSWKVDVREKGISDAFVTAYRDGKRITLTEAKAISTKEGDAALVEIDKVFNTASKNEMEIWEAFDSKVASQNSEINYRIKLGPYTDQVPMNEAHFILDFKDNITYMQDDNGDFSYVTNTPLSLEKARNLKTSYANRSIQNLRIVAFDGDEEIDYAKAKQLLEN